MAPPPPPKRSSADRSSFGRRSSGSLDEKPDPKKPDKPKFGEYKWTTYGDVFAAAQRVGAFLVSDGGGKLAPGALVGLFAPNRAVRERARARERTLFAASARVLSPRVLTRVCSLP